MTHVHAEQGPSVRAVPGQVSHIVMPVATSLQDCRSPMLKHRNAFAVFDHNGDAVPRPDSQGGLFYRDTRDLRHLQLMIGDPPPMLLTSTCATPMRSDLRLDQSRKFARRSGRT